MGHIISWLSFYVARFDFTALPSTILFAVVLIFLLLTTPGSLQVAGRQALFTNKLALAVLVAGAIRVREGWLPALQDRALFGSGPIWTGLFRGSSALIWLAAPLAFLAAGLAGHIADRRVAKQAALLGIVAPLVASFLVIGFIDASVFVSQYYTPSITPNVAMALWGKAAPSAERAPMLAALITAFGAIRFGLKTLSVFAPNSARGTVRFWVGAVILGAAAWLAGNPYKLDFSMAVEIAITTLAICGRNILRRSADRLPPHGPTAAN